MKLNDLSVVLLTHGIEQVQMKPFDSPAVLKMNVIYKNDECFMYAGMTNYILQFWVRFKSDLNKSESIYELALPSGKNYKDNISHISIPGLEPESEASFFEGLIDSLKSLHIELYLNAPHIT